MGVRDYDAHTPSVVPRSFNGYLSYTRIATITPYSFPITRFSASSLQEAALGAPGRAGQ